MSDGRLVLSAALTARYGGGAPVLRDARLEIRRGEVLGLVGQSGSGKSTMALALMRLLHLKGGTVSGVLRLEDDDLMAVPERRMRSVRGRRMALVLQSPLTSLNPVLKIRTQLAEAWKAHAGGGRERCMAAVRAAMREAALPDDDAFLDRRPPQISLGQAQRVLIAMAVLHRPPLLIADEPTSALDVSTQAEILQLFRTLCRGLSMGLLFISHDMLSVARISDRIAVLHAGEVVECESTRRLLLEPRHAYTRHLLGSLPIPAAWLAQAVGDESGRAAAATAR